MLAIKVSSRSSGEKAHESWQISASQLFIPPVKGELSGANLGIDVSDNRNRIRVICNHVPHLGVYGSSNRYSDDKVSLFFIFS